uniref:Lipase_3 domain-containing protein n=1 Tax=Panagrellus redivivus TaxID=6233 RepID=A0A7E4V8A4_PANRE
MWSTIFLSVFLISTASASSYSDSFARDKALPLSAAAYSNYPENCLRNAFENTTLVGKYDLACDMFKGDSCFGFVALNHLDKSIIISFRGSEGFMQLLSEGSEAVFGKKVPSTIGGGISEYFYNGYLMIWSAGMRSDFLKAKNLYPSYEVWATGHSLGGSMATIAAGVIVKLGYADAGKVKLYTFGQPRTGDKDFATAHDKLLPESFRVTHSHDMVPHLPPKNFESYYHHKLEEWYKKENMGLNSNHIECDNDESKLCSDGAWFDFSINDHLHYFDRMVSEYGNAGCQ